MFYMSWHYRRPLDACIVYDEAELLLTEAVPVAGRYTLLSYQTALNEHLVIHDIALFGYQLEEYLIGEEAHQKWVALEAPALVNKGYWRVTDDAKITSQMSGSGLINGWQRFAELSVSKGRLSPIIVPPGRTVRLEYVSINPAAGLSLSPLGSRIHAYWSGYSCLNQGERP